MQSMANHDTLASLVLCSLLTYVRIQADSPWPVLADDAIERPIGCDSSAVVALLEVVSDPCLTTLTVDIPYPVEAHRSAFIYTGLFAASNYPMDGAIQIRCEVDVLKQWFGRNETDDGWKVLENRHSTQ